MMQNHGGPQVECLALGGLKGPLATREMVLLAAEALFYSEGIRAATMFGIAERAGVSKRTLYYHFRSKDDLVEACLARHGKTEQDKFATALDGDAEPVEARVRKLFTMLARDVRNPRWKGCWFARAAGELAGLPGHPGLLAARKHRKAFESWLAQLLRDDGFPDADLLARRFVVLFDGAIVQGFLHHDPDYVLEAGEMAARLVSRPA